MKKSFFITITAIVYLTGICHASSERDTILIIKSHGIQFQQIVILSDSFYFYIPVQDNTKSDSLVLIAKEKLDKSAKSQINKLIKVISGYTATSYQGKTISSFKFEIITKKRKLIIESIGSNEFKDAPVSIKTIINLTSEILSWPTQ